MQQSVLILGATGRFGRNAAKAFQDAGWHVRRFDRSRDRLEEAARGVDVIVNGFNPVYPDWARDLPRLTGEVIRAARLSGASVIVPGNVYVFGEATPPPWSAGSLHQAQNPLGRLRREMEEAYAASGVRTILVRAGDFIDTEASGNWFDSVMVKRLDKGIFTYPGRSDIPHAWAYLPDLARACVALAEQRARLPVFTDLPFPGYTLTGEEMRAALARVTGRQVRLKTMSYLPLYLLRPFWRMAAPLLEMRYLWNLPHWLDGAAFDACVPGFGTTPLEVALSRAIGLGSGQREVEPDEAVSTGA